MDFADQTEQLWQIYPPRWVSEPEMTIPYFYLLFPINKKKKKNIAYKAYFCEIYGHLLKNSLLFLYKLNYRGLDLT